MAAGEARRGNPPELLVIVPGRVDQQPRAAVAAIRRYADRVIEMGLSVTSRDSYYARNNLMVDHADQLVAFWNGTSGGTGHTIKSARRRSIPVEVIDVLAGGGVARVNARRNPLLVDLYYPVPHLASSYRGVRIIALNRYTSAGVRSNPVSDFARAVRRGRYSYEELDYWAETSWQAMSYREFHGATLIMPIPRRFPYLGSSFMLPLAEEIARKAQRDGVPLRAEERMVREALPRGGVVAHGRQRFSSEAHAESLRYISAGDRSVILLDNVITMGGSVGGCALAIQRYAPGTEVSAFSLTVGLAFEFDDVW